MKKNLDPLQDKSFKSPGIIEMLKETFLGSKRKFDCVQIEVSSFCPGECQYCPHTVNREKWTQKHMSAQTFARLWPLLRISERAHLQGWGEPLLQTRFFDMVKLARKAGCEVSTTTCGIKMDEDIASSIVKSGMDIIAFSLTGTDSLSNSNRKNIDFEKVCSAIKILDTARKKNPGDTKLEIHLAYLLLADRIESVSSLPQLMDKLNIDAAVVSTLDFIAIPEHKNLAFAAHDFEKIKIAESILLKASEIAQKYGRQIYFSLPSLTPNAAEGGCRENILHTLYINTEGDLSPCVYLNVQGENERTKVYGNVNDNDVLNIWDELDYRQFRNRLESGEPDSACLVCPKRFEKIY